MNSKILITGSTGKTGQEVVKRLLAAGREVRALIRKEDDRSEKLKNQGAELVIGDTTDVRSVKSMLKDVESLYFVYPIVQGFADASSNIVCLAKEAGVQYMVNMSQKPARINAESHASQQHWVSEELFMKSGVPSTIVRPTFFADWLLTPFVAPAIRSHNVLKLPFGDGRHAPISGYDIGRFVAALLLDPEPHMGKRYDLFGPKQYNQNEVAAIASKVLGRQIRYKALTIDEFDEVLKSRNFSDYIRQHLRSVALDYQNGVFEGTDEIIEKVTGTRPLDIQEFIERNKALLAPAAALAVVK